LIYNTLTLFDTIVCLSFQLSFEVQYPPVFDEPQRCYDHDNRAPVIANGEQNNDMKFMLSHPLPDLLEHHRMQQKSVTTESNFEQMCSLRGTHHASGSTTMTLQSIESSNAHDRLDDEQDEF
jgi:hypothetical protein